MADIQKLLDEKAAAVLQIADCHKKLASEEAMLNSLLSQPQTAENEQYLEASKKAYRQGIKAWKLSIIAFQGDVDRCQAEIDDALKKPLDLAKLASDLRKLSPEDKVRFTNVMHGYLSGTLPPKS